MAWLNVQNVEQKLVAKESLGKWLVAQTEREREPS